MIISAALTPAKGTDADFEAWYKKEHYLTLATCTGYIRTRRYKLTGAPTAKGPVPTYLALHEFECDSLPEEELQKTGETEWSKKVMGSLEGMEIGVYRHVGSFGDLEAEF